MNAAASARNTGAERQATATAGLLAVAGFLLLALAGGTLPFLLLLVGAAAWRLLAQPEELVDWSRLPQRVAGSAIFPALAFASAALFAPSRVSFAAALVAWIEVVLLLSRVKGPVVPRSVAYLSLVHVLLAAFVVRPAGAAPILLVYVFLLVRTLSVADRRVGDVPEEARFAAADLGMFVTVATLALALFLTLPRMAAPAARRPKDPAKGPAPGVRDPGGIVGSEPGQGILGFSINMSLGEFTELIKNKRLALRVRVPGPGPASGTSNQPPEVRLRGVSYLDYRAGRWIPRPCGENVEDAADGTRDGMIQVRPPGGAAEPPGVRWRAEIELEPGDTTAVFVPPLVRALEAAALLGDGEEGFAFARAPEQRVRYRVETAVLAGDPAPDARVRAVPADSPYLTLPGAQERYRALAEELAASRVGAAGRIAAIRDGLMRRSTYSLKVAPAPPDVDPAERFLWEDRTGYCVHYATGLALLVRAAGIPARVAGGYISSEWDPARREFLVRQSHAHAWVEVPFAGLGWVPFDATPPQVAPEEAPLGDLTQRPAARADAGRGGILGDLEEFDRDRLLNDLRAAWIALWTAAAGVHGWREAGLAWAAIMVFLVLVAVVSLRGRRRREARRRRGAARGAAPAYPLPAVPFWRDLVRVAARRGWVRAEAETPAEFGRRLARAGGAEAAPQIAAAYYQVAFGGQALPPEEAAGVRAAVAAVDRILAARRPAPPGKE